MRQRNPRWASAVGIAWRVTSPGAAAYQIVRLDDELSQDIIPSPYLKLELTLKLSLRFA
jgi:hypothetical protein